MLKVPKNQRGKQSVAHIRSPQQEKELAKRFNGKLTVGSGNQYDKGDIKNCNGFIRIEAKTTKNKSFSVTREMLEKIAEASIGCGEIPAIVVEFIDEKGVPEMDIAIVPTYALHFIGD